MSRDRESRAGCDPVRGCRCVRSSAWLSLSLSLSLSLLQCVALH
ncbi:hypothetical protein GLA29479_4948 [Lysobacter antibioticus]|nr:hypothetical protein GLA29479_4948 [Lysobacter antibioticus]